MAISEYSKNWLKQTQQSPEESFRKSEEFKRFIYQYQIKGERKKNLQRRRRNYMIQKNMMESYLRDLNKKKTP